ncbi:hypothetical protein RIU76_06455 [Latilactobacillus sakei subsp. sakei]|uniref:hypothetical protein n=1 Tax=Latilactobacillus sakei TaxID=1599 RepID=UPI002859AEB6|nr:hypothetical protein [Latilactobacillus sakei]MDR7924366.1 hypothetical protein [Latilactobacillus sakei subsp. sakei]
MKTTYVESDKTWVISHVKEGENGTARQLARVLKGEGKEVILLPGDLEVAKKQHWFLEWLGKNGPIRFKSSQVKGKSDTSYEQTHTDKIAEFISIMDYYEKINLYIALLIADKPKLSTDEAYEYALMHIDGDDPVGLHYQLDKAMHMTTYK